MPRREFPRKTKRDRFAYAGGNCESCGAKVRLGHFAYHHAVDTGWLGGDNSFDNCRVLCDDCHAPITKRQSAAKAKSDRIRDGQIGALRDRVKIPSRPFPKFKPQRTATTPLQRPLPQDRRFER